MADTFEAVSHRYADILLIGLLLLRTARTTINYCAVSANQLNLASLPTACGEDFLMAKRVSIIGAGPGGLAAAMIPEKAGLDVEVFDQLDRVGGHIRLPPRPLRKPRGRRNRSERGKNQVGR